MNILKYIILLLSFFSGQAAFAQTAATPSPCQEDARFSQFDFWIGNWDVRLASGQLAGTNEVRSLHGGCVIVENWTSATGGTGMSINYLDHATGEWVQIWNGGHGSQINIRGGMTDEGMLLVGTIHEVASDTTAPFRGLWSPLDDGRVRQFFEQYDPDSESWQTWFEGFYSRKPAD